MKFSEEASLLESETRKRFPTAGENNRLALERIPKGGSGRRYYRLSRSDQDSMIVARYEHDRPENRNFAAVARFLEDVPVRIPRILDHDSEQRIVWMQDLGDQDLTALVHESDWEMVEPVYRSVLEEVVRLHRLGHQKLASPSLSLEKEFSEELYLWEQEYFARHFLGQLRQWPIEEALAFVESDPWRALAVDLARHPRVLVHRDLQSQNVLVHQGLPYLIDFQGMRPGLAAYDIASLLYDPYVALLPDQRANLKEYYFSLLKSEERELVEATWNACAIQRLMQALGAYGNLALNKGLIAYLDFVDPAWSDLQVLIGENPGLASSLDALSRRG